MTCIKKYKNFSIATNMVLYQRGYRVITQNFCTDRGMIDYIATDPETDELVFVVIIENRNKDFKKRENWNKVMLKRFILYTARWYKVKFKDGRNSRIDIIEAFIDEDKVKLKHYTHTNLNSIEN